MQRNQCFLQLNYKFHTAALVVVSDALFFDFGAGTSGTLAEVLDEPVPVHSKLDMYMKAPLADIHSSGPVPDDQ